MPNFPTRDGQSPFAPLVETVACLVITGESSHSSGFLERGANWISQPSPVGVCLFGVGTTF